MTDDELIEASKVFRLGREVGERIRTLTAERDELHQLVEEFVIAECDYMRRNKLGDPEKQHNVKWARRLGITAVPRELE